MFVIPQILKPPNPHRITALLCGLLMDGLHTGAAVIEYLDKACEHPTGRFWMDCLICHTFTTIHFPHAARRPPTAALPPADGPVLVHGWATKMTCCSSPGILTWYRTFHIDLLAVGCCLSAATQHKGDGNIRRKVRKATAASKGLWKKCAGVPETLLSLKAESANYVDLNGQEAPESENLQNAPQIRLIAIDSIAPLRSESPPWR